MPTYQDYSIRLNACQTQDEVDKLTRSIRYDSYLEHGQKLRLITQAARLDLKRQKQERSMVLCVPCAEALKDVYSLRFRPGKNTKKTCDECGRRRYCGTYTVE